MTESVDDETPQVVRRGYLFAIIPEWVLYHPDLSDRAVRLFGVLDRFADADGTCYPSRSVLGARLGVSVDTVDRGLAELTTAQAVTVEKRYRPGREGEKARQTSNLYVLHGLPPGAADVRPGGRSAAGAGGRSAAHNESHLEREPPLGTSFQEDDDRAPVGSSSSSEDLAIYRKAAEIVVALGSGVKDPDAYATKVALKMSRERRSLLAELRRCRPDLDDDGLAGWVAQGDNPFGDPDDYWIGETG